MYNNRYSRGNSYSRDSFGGGRGPQRPFRRFNGRSRGPAKKFMDVSKFINKTPLEAKVEEYKNQHTFADFNIHDKLKQNILQRGFNAPTPIQDQAIPHILEGKDIVGMANTGTGKTGAFLIPLIHKMMMDPTIKVLVIAPTRELAMQIRDEFRAFSSGTSRYATTCIGGANIRNQIFDLRRNPHIVIGTPGRLKDLVERKALNLSSFNHIVLDEVDRMLDMGFIADIKYLISLLREDRQSLFFSATTTPEINTLMKMLLREPVTVSVKSGDTAATVEQDIVKFTNRSHKIEVLHDLLNQEEVRKVLIFGQTKRGVEDLFKELMTRGFKVGSIHGDKPQFQRQKALTAFKQDMIQILVATDVAARGLDIPDVTHVINYDLPQTYEDYVHRIGRTGRANKKGKALTFVQ